MQVFNKILVMNQLRKVTKSSFDIIILLLGSGWEDISSSAMNFEGGGRGLCVGVSGLDFTILSNK